MTALLRIALPFLLVAGCLNGEYSSHDAAAPVPDLATPRSFDLAGVDLYGASNCAALNACERACMTNACVLLCRKMASPTAVALQMDLQSCFTQFCPTAMGQVCQPDAMGMLPPDCTTCINNTYLPLNERLLAVADDQRMPHVPDASQRLHGGYVMAKRGRILAVKWGYNPNSSSLGVDVTFLLFGMAAIALLTPIISLFLRARRARPAPPPPPAA